MSETLDPPKARPYSGKPFKNMPKHYLGPDDLRDELIEKFSIEWVASYLDQCDWINSTRTLIPNTSFAYRQMMARASKTLARLEVNVEDPKSNGTPRHQTDQTDFPAPPKRRTPW